VAGSDVLDEAVRYDKPAGECARRQRHVLYVVATIILCLIVLSALIDAVTGVPLYGVDQRTARASANGIEISVGYPRVIRGQLDSPLDVSVQRQGGFAGDVTISVSADYLGLFINQRVSPDPSSQSEDEDNVISTFDAPPGDLLEVEWDMAPRPRPWFSGVTGVASVLDDQGQPIVSVRFHTDVRP
jgi:hypothetical protein